ncbi:hypothetical protein [Alloactinosynnema sp. L-07]|uniref:hypothetical protein n=1 Tax=Alloactinosynnema sp. L-07 TaxID=1653480 RepID=UPI00065F0AD7|nr:hypothetical protein [Alloactinosynnema sp. L-07]CRK56902.1 hypothetical protein [Alloactinosynnema sp. L-07]
MNHHHVFPKGHRCRIYTHDAGRINCAHGFTERLARLHAAPNPAREPYDASAHRVLRMAADKDIVHKHFVLQHRLRRLGPREIDAARRLHNCGYLDRVHPVAAGDDHTQHLITLTERGLALLAWFAQQHAIIPVVDTDKAAACEFESRSA